MQTVVITIHLLIVLALVGVVLVQRSEGGGLGIGGGSGFMTARGTKNALTRLTAILACCFFLTSIILTVMELMPGGNGSDILRQIPAQATEKQPSLLDQLGGAKTAAPEAASSAAAPGAPDTNASGDSNGKAPVPAAGSSGAAGATDKADSAAAPLGQ